MPRENPDESSFAGKGSGEKPVALVSGAAQGIGKAVSQHLRDEGFRVFGIDVDDAAIGTVENEPEMSGIRLFCADVASEDDVEKVCREVEQAAGRIDLLVNNAGISAIGRPVEKLSLEEWNRVLAVNLTGAFLLVRQSLPLLRRNGGSIVTIASTRALMSEPDSEAYAASKGGLVSLTHALAASLGPEVRVNSVSPGWIDVTAWKAGASGGATFAGHHHAQHPCGRVGKPEDIARLVAFLGDPENGFITGQNFVADGGMTRKMIYEE